MIINMSEIKKQLIEEMNQRVHDKILERTKADLLIKLISNADDDNEALSIAAMGTTYKRTGLHFDYRNEKMSNDIRYFKKNERLSFRTDNEKPVNKLIIGDNYEALQNLLIEYKGKIDVIYIDPPYGKDSMGEFAQTNYNNAITRDNLLSMMYPRLCLAKLLLSDEGVIFCSMDDKNQAYMKCLFDEIFTEKNFITCFPKKGSGGRQDSTHYAIIHEYVICYCKNKDNYVSCKVEIDKKYTFFDEEKQLHYNTQLLRKWGDSSRRQDRPNLYYPIYYNLITSKFTTKEQSGQDWLEIYPKLSEDEDGRWRWGKTTMQEAFENNEVIMINKKKSFIPYEKVYEDPDDITTKLYSSWIDEVDGSTAAKLLKSIFRKKAFDYPKAVDLVEKIISMATDKEDAIILDFFAGSGTTAHAVLEKNSFENKNMQFIVCQLNEKTKEAPNGIAYDVTSKRLKRIMTGECYDGSKDFKWAKDNEPYGGNLDVYEIASVANNEFVEGKSPFDVIDETLYGKERFKTLREKIDWVCKNFQHTQKVLESYEEWSKRTEEK